MAHVDMPVESGPTSFLPYSQTMERNYLTWRDEAFKAHYQENFVQLPLAKVNARSRGVPVTFVGIRPPPFTT